MAKKINVSPALIATAVFVKATVKSRCRAGMVFNNETETRVELDKLPEGGLAAIEADPYLKVIYETEDMLEDDYAKKQVELQEQAIQRAEVAEDKLNDLKAELEKSEDRITVLKAQLASKEVDLTAANEQINTLDDSLIKANAEIEELKAKVSELEKAAAAPKAKK